MLSFLFSKRKNPRAADFFLRSYSVKTVVDERRPTEAVPCRRRICGETEGHRQHEDKDDRIHDKQCEKHFHRLVHLYAEHARFTAFVVNVCRINGQRDEPDIEHAEQETVRRSRIRRERETEKGREHAQSEHGICAQDARRVFRAVCALFAARGGGIAAKRRNNSPLKFAMSGKSCNFAA